MKTLYIDCGMGAAGDMLAASLLELMPDPDEAVARLNAIGIEGVTYSRERTSRCGIAATRLVVKVKGVEECTEEHAHEHEHGHEHCHEHCHDMGMSTSIATIMSTRITPITMSIAVWSRCCRSLRILRCRRM